MAQAQMINLGGTSSPESYEKQQAINRQQQLAQLLMQQGTQQPTGQMVSGRYVAPSFFQYAAPLFQMYAGKSLAKEGDKAMADLLREQSQRQQKIGTEFFESISPSQQTQMAGPYGIGVGPEGRDIPMPIAGVPDFKNAVALAADPNAPAYVKNYVNEILKPRTFKEGETFQVPSFAGGQISFNQMGGGGMALPESLKYAIAVGRLPRDPSTWTKDQADYAKSLVESKAGASANKFDFSNLLGKSGAAQIGEMLKDSKVTALGAIQQADAANRIISALDTGKVIVGPSANARLTVAQVSQLLGAGGENQDEMLRNSRTVIQGLAQLTLQGRKQMRGEGAITESESKLAERAQGGDINFTAGELRQLAEAARRSAKFAYQQHEGMINTLQADPQNRALVPYYQVQANPSIFEPQSSKPRAQSENQRKADAIIKGQ